MCWPSVAVRPLAIALLILFEGSTGSIIAALTLDDKLASIILFFFTVGAAAIALLSLIGVVAIDPGVTTGGVEVGAGTGVWGASSQASDVVVVVVDDDVVEWS